METLSPQNTPCQERNSAQFHALLNKKNLYVPCCAMVLPQTFGCKMVQGDGSGVRSAEALKAKLEAILCLLYLHSIYNLTNTHKK